MTAIISPACQLSASIVPTPDATDFPPVNLRNMDLECPRITAIAANTGRSPIPANVVVKIFASIQGERL